MALLRQVLSGSAKVLPQIIATRRNKTFFHTPQEIRTLWTEFGENDWQVLSKKEKVSASFWRKLLVRPTMTSGPGLPNFKSQTESDCGVPERTRGKDHISCAEHLRWCKEMSRQQILSNLQAGDLWAAYLLARDLSETWLSFVLG